MAQQEKTMAQQEGPRHRHPTRTRGAGPLRDLAALAALAALVTCAVPAAPATGKAADRGPAYTITDLGTLAGLPESSALAINAAGQVVGIAQPKRDSPEQRPFLWDDGRMTDLGTMGGWRSAALGVNAAGQVVGEADLADRRNHAFSSQRGAMTDLGALPGGRESSAHGVNATGQVVGVSTVTAGQRVSRGETRAVHWVHGAIVDLNALLPERSG